MEFQYGDPVHDPQAARAARAAREFYPLCLTCGYDLRGAPVARCPECGNAFVYRHWERAVRDAKDTMAHVEGLLAWLPMCWKLVVAGTVLALLAIVPGVSRFWQGFGRLSALLCGACAFLLALNVLRIRRVPIWARPHMTVQPDYTSALVGLLGGLGLIVAATVIH